MFYDIQEIGSPASRPFGRPPADSLLRFKRYKTLFIWDNYFQSFP